MILKHRDRAVLRFDWVEPFGVKNVEVDSAQARFLPLGVRARVAGGDRREIEIALEDWLMHRTAPLNRKGYRELLVSLGFPPGDPRYLRHLIEFCRGLSLNDVHWVVKEDDDERWSSANLYDNPFSATVATTAFSGLHPNVQRDATTSPEYTTNGTLAKCWRRLGDRILLYKAGELEPYSEFLSAQVAAAMELPHVAYGLSRFKNRLCSVCPLFTCEKVGYVPAGKLLTREEAVADGRFADIFFFDAVVFNTDRHLGNFGFLVDNDANEVIGPAPIFDNGRGLFSKLTDINRFPEGLEPALLSNWLAFPNSVTDERLARLEKLRNFVFAPDAHYNLPSDRLETAQYLLRKRIELILKYHENADDYVAIMPEKCSANSVRKPQGPQSLDETILTEVRLHPTITTRRLAALCAVSPRTIATHVKSLQAAGRLRRVGATKNGHWESVAPWHD